MPAGSRGEQQDVIGQVVELTGVRRELGGWVGHVFPDSVLYSRSFPCARRSCESCQRPLGRPGGLHPQSVPDPFPSFLRGGACGVAGGGLG